MGLLRRTLILQSFEKWFILNVSIQGLAFVHTCDPVLCQGPVYTLGLVTRQGQSSFKYRSV